MIQPGPNGAADELASLCGAGTTDGLSRTVILWTRGLATVLFCLARTRRTHAHARPLQQRIPPLTIGHMTFLIAPLSELIRYAIGSWPRTWRFAVCMAPIYLLCLLAMLTVV